MSASFARSQISRTFKCPKSLGRIIFDCNSFSKNSFSSVYSCLCNEAHLKKYINSDNGHIITGDLNIINFNTLKKTDEKWY